VDLKIVVAIIGAGLVGVIGYVIGKSRCNNNNKRNGFVGGRGMHPGMHMMGMGPPPGAGPAMGMPYDPKQMLGGMPGMTNE